MNRLGVSDLERTAVRCRQNVLRMMKAAKSGHLGPAFSCIDIVTALYFGVMNIDPSKPDDPKRDRFLLSAGHKALAQYAVLAEKGFFGKEVLDTYGDHKSRLPGHPDMHRLSGIEVCTGSLGHGISLACGMAMSLKRDQLPSRVFVIAGEGEMAEGSNWEAAAVAKHYSLDNLVVFADVNTLQISGRSKDVMDLSPLTDRFKAFGWAVREIDGNNMEEILNVCNELPFEKGKPNFIAANTIKGKGFREAEDAVDYHYWSADEAGLLRLEQELEEQYKNVQ